MRIRAILMGASLLAGGLPFVTQAQPVQGPYVGLGLGANLMQDQDIDHFGSPGTSYGGARVSLGHDAGLVGLGSVGYGFGNGLRAELEGGYRGNAVSGEDGFHRAGKDTKTSLMVNALYDFDTGGPVYPYVGAGIGTAFRSYDLDAASMGASDALHLGGHSANFAYQAILGASMPVESVPGLAMTAEYRFMGTAGSDRLQGVDTVDGVSAPVGARLHDDLNHSFLLGVRYAFGGAPARAMPVSAESAPAAGPPVVVMGRSGDGAAIGEPLAHTRGRFAHGRFMVFFDQDSARLTPQSRPVVERAAEEFRRLHATTIEVQGYTDSTGTPANNEVLAKHRAAAVAAELVRDGVPRGAIEVVSFGERHPLRPTGPGVNEPANRRVTILLR